MNILFTLCGRAGSKGVKGKNARDFLNIPLVWYSMAGIYLFCKKHDALYDNVKVVLNTDSEELKTLVSQVSDLEVEILHREEYLAGDKVPKTAVILDSLIRAEILFNMDFDIVVDLDITSPLRKVEDIVHAVVRKIERPEVNVVYSVAPSRRNPYFNMVKEANGFFCDAFPSTYTTRQEAPVFYDMNASIYAYSALKLKTLDLVTFFNTYCDAIVMQDTGILDIDSEEDYELMQVIAKYLFENKAGYSQVYNKAVSWSK